MTLPSYSFTGADFFSRVRFEMDRNRGMFGGSDGDLQFVVMDGLLYRLEIFQRPAHQNFTDAGQALQIRDPDIRVLVNGQTMGQGWHQYFTHNCLLGPCSLQMNGEIIVSGTPLRGDPPSYPSHRFFGRENAIPLWRYHMNQGDPSSYRPILYHAMGKLVSPQFNP